MNNFYGYFYQINIYIYYTHNLVFENNNVCYFDLLNICVYKLVPKHVNFFENIPSFYQSHG